MTDKAFLEAVFLLFGRKLAKVPPFPVNDDGIKFDFATNQWILAPFNGGGEANTSSNVGTGAGLALPKVGVDLPFKSLLGTAGEIILTPTATEIIFSVNSALKQQRLFVQILCDTDTIIWINQPSALTEIFGNTRARNMADLTNMNQCRFFGNLLGGGFAGSVLFPQVDIGAGFIELANVANALDLSITTLGTFDTGFQPIISGAKVVAPLIRLAGQGGNGMLDPAFNQLVLEFRV